MKKALLVEDMPVVRKKMTKMLSELNVEVISVETADRALDSIRKGGGYDLVIGDVSMPGSMDGGQLARRVRQSQQDLPVLLISGFASKIAKLEEQGEAGLNFLKKPFDLDALSEAVDGALEKAPA